MQFNKFLEFLIIDNKSIGDLSTNISIEMKTDKKFRNCKDECTNGAYSMDCVGFTTYQHNGKSFCQLKAGNTACDHSYGTTSFVKRTVQNQCKGILE